MASSAVTILHWIEMSVYAPALRKVALCRIRESVSAAAARIRAQGCSRSEWRD